MRPPRLLAGFGILFCVVLLAPAASAAPQSDSTRYYFCTSVPDVVAKYMSAVAWNAPGTPQQAFSNYLTKTYPELRGGVFLKCYEMPSLASAQAEVKKRIALNSTAANSLKYIDTQWNPAQTPSAPAPTTAEAIYQAAPAPVAASAPTGGPSQLVYYLCWTPVINIREYLAAFGYTTTTDPRKEFGDYVKESFSLSPPGNFIPTCVRHASLAAAQQAMTQRMGTPTRVQGMLVRRVNTRWNPNTPQSAAAPTPAPAPAPAAPAPAPAPAPSALAPTPWLGPQGNKPSYGNPSGPQTTAVYEFCHATSSRALGNPAMYYTAVFAVGSDPAERMKVQNEFRQFLVSKYAYKPDQGVAYDINCVQPNPATQEAAQKQLQGYLANGKKQTAVKIVETGWAFSGSQAAVAAAASAAASAAAAPPKMGNQSLSNPPGAASWYPPPGSLVYEFCAANGVTAAGQRTIYYSAVFTESADFKGRTKILDTFRQFLVAKYSFKKDPGSFQEVVCIVPRADTPADVDRAFQDYLTNPQRNPGQTVVSTGWKYQN